MTKERALQKAKQYREWAEKARLKSLQIDKEFNDDPNSEDWNYWTQPVHANARGRAFANSRERLRAKIGKSSELLQKAKRFDEKADNLERFANTHKGDAERKREAKRNAIDEKYKVGDKLYSPVYRTEFTILKINKKTLRVEDTHGQMTLQKHLFIL